MDKSSGTKPMVVNIDITENGTHTVSIERGPHIIVKTDVPLTEGAEPTKASAAVGNPVDSVADEDYIRLPESKMVVTKINDDGSVFTKSHEESGEYSSEASKMV